MSLRPQRSLNWAFTSFDDLPEKDRPLTPSTSPVVVLELQSLIDRRVAGLERAPLRAWIFQLEQCPTTHRLHLQGHLQLSSAKTMAQVIKVLPFQASLKIKVDSPQDATCVSNSWSYCEKSQTRLAGPWKSLTPPTFKGRSPGLVAAADSIVAGADLGTIALSDPTTYARHARGLQELKHAVDTPRDWETACYILWGVTRSGKTSAVYNFYGASKIFSKSGDAKWFNGYSGQPVALFDEFDWSAFKLPDVLKFMDRFPMLVEIKGLFVQFKPRVVIFSGNTDPHTWFAASEEEPRKAFFKRVTDTGFILHYSRSLDRGDAAGRALAWAAFKPIDEWSRSLSLESVQSGSPRAEGPMGDD